MAICHFIIDNVVIGDSGEECFLPTWFFQVTRIRDFFQANLDSLYLSDFDELSDREIYEIIIKSNQLENEFDNNYLHLAQLDNIVWQRHYLTIDETINGFCICYFIKNQQIRFIIEKIWPQPVNNEQRIFLYKSIDVDFFIKTINECVEFLEINSPYLLNHKNSGRAV